VSRCGVDLDASGQRALRHETPCSRPVLEQITRYSLLYSRVPGFLQITRLCLCSPVFRGESTCRGASSLGDRRASGSVVPLDDQCR
jgi:hypothetical protein